MICRFRIQLCQYKIEINNGARQIPRSQREIFSVASDSLCPDLALSQRAAISIKLGQSPPAKNRWPRYEPATFLASSLLPLAHLARPQDYRASAPGLTANLILDIRTPRGGVAERGTRGMFRMENDVFYETYRLRATRNVSRAETLSRANDLCDNSDGSCCAWIDPIVVAISIATRA